MDFDPIAFEADLRTLVGMDSGSTCVDGVNQVADWFAQRFAALGWPVSFEEPKPGQFGKSLYTWWGNPRTLDLLILCHVDTVFPAGTAAQRPFRVNGDRYVGPGVADMKAGCLMALITMEQLHRSGRLSGNIGLFFNGEHELSCPNTRASIEEKSLASRVVVTTEPARADGSCVRQRKGILRYTIRFHGHSAHSGVDPEKGHCAVTEMARMILALRGLADSEAGIGVNPGLVKGGISVNAVPDLAECRLDVRVSRNEDAKRLDATIRRMAEQPVDPGVRIELEGGITRPPMIPNERSEKLIRGINRIAGGYGLDLAWSSSGGGSDASFASFHGIPSLCGLGPVGGGYHTEREYVEIRGLRERICIFHDMVEAICNGTI